MADKCVCPAYGINNHIYVKEPGCKAKQYSARYELDGSLNCSVRLILHYVYARSDGTYFLLCTERDHPNEGFYGFDASSYEKGAWKEGKAGEEPVKA